MSEAVVSEIASVSQAFHWGLLELSDADSLDELPDWDSDSGWVVGRHGFLLRVRHADDIEVPDDLEVPEDLGDDEDLPEFLVELTFLRGGAPGAAVTRDVSLEVPSGRLLIGDSDGGTEIELPAPGRWRVQVQAVPEDVPEQVRFYIAPDDGEAAS
ncbi:hypothetical protein [Motilibacter aurantiacus]|uniref:hypothetical protein n=1 Tax=Motilibacter aurantiacus TaxID=2714955 RepID=UPI0014098F04|nr:hypothetical protein [Motilibacter aurantiacus]NHC46803.1 hypothetical protein [Motilibacter aurantiacus]